MLGKNYAPKKHFNHTDVLSRNGIVDTDQMRGSWERKKLK